MWNLYEITPQRIFTSYIVILRYFQPPNNKQLLFDDICFTLHVWLWDFM